MKNEFQIASVWKLLFTGLALIALYYFSSALYTLTNLWSEYSDSEITAFRLMGIVLVSTIYLVFILWCLFLMFFGLSKYFCDKLSLTENGIEYQSFGCKVFAQWENIEKIEISPLLGFISGVSVSAENVVSRSKLVQKISLMKNSARQIYVPLSLFDLDWRKSAIGKTIQQHVPRLFAQNKNSRIQMR